MKLKKIFRGLKIQIFGSSPKLVNKTLFGQNITIINGTIRDLPDKDDAWFAELVLHAKVFFDLGANIGSTALIAKLVNPNLSVTLVEGNKEALSWAAKNLIYNNLIHNVSFEPVLVGDRLQDDVEFFTIGVGAAGSIHKSNAETAALLGASMLVPMTTLDNLVLKHNKFPDFVKIDVEGAESIVLKGSIQLAQKRNTRFLVEMHNTKSLPMLLNANLILEWCAAMDFKAWYLKDKAVLLSPQSIAHRGRCHLLLQPSDWPFPEYLLKVNEGDAISHSSYQTV